MSNISFNVSTTKPKISYDIKLMKTGKQEYSTVVDLDMPEGDQIITPAEGKVFSKVTVNKPDTLIPENIRKDINIGGVVGNLEKIEEEEKYLINVIDYDGTILKSAELSSGETFILPDNPTHEGLIFQGWSSSADIIDNTVTVEDNDIIIGPMYETESGLTEIDIELTTITGLTVKLQNLIGMTSIDWGDGTTDSTLTHTYSETGDYTIKLDGVNVLGGSIFSQSSTDYNYYCKNIRCSNKIKSFNTGCFQYCESLTNITLSNNITYLPQNIFYYCYSLKNVILPNTITSINQSSFNNCYNLKNIVMPNSIKNIYDNAFQNCNSLLSIVIPNSVIKIYGNVFQQCQSLIKIIIPSSITSMGSNVFNSCYSLTTVIISNGVTSIGSNAFKNCYNLTNVVIPNSVKTIENSSFSYCSSLANIIIPDSVTEISSNAFSYCYSLTDVIIPNSVKTIGASTFSNCFNLKNIIIPSSVTSIGTSVFRYCYSLNEAVVLNKVIPGYAFNSCYSLKNIVISDNVNRIGSYAFSYCYPLTKISIPNSVTTIEASSFNVLYATIEYDFSTFTSVPTLASTNVFAGINKTCKMKIPNSLLEEWKTATNWSAYANYMIGV